MTEFESLNEYSQKVYDFLKSNYPTYLKNVSVLPCKNFVDNFIKFEIDSPNKKASYNLTFDTDDNQITIFFDNYHCHYDNFSNLNFNEEIELAIETIAKIIADELIVVSYYSGGNLTMASLEERFFLDSYYEKLVEDKIDTIITTSWTGAFDNQMIMNRIATSNDTLQKAGRTWWQKLFGSE
jgi:hypothetical protein